jgi:uncharacterized protein YbjT (DUF2867 family)
MLVTGATGNVGSEVVRLLLDLGCPVRAASRDSGGVDRSRSEGTKHVHFDFARPKTYVPALRGVDRLFLVRTPEISNTKKYVNPVFDAARAAVHRSTETAAV